MISNFPDPNSRTTTCNPCVKLRLVEAAVALVLLISAPAFSWTVTHDFDALADGTKTCGLGASGSSVISGAKSYSAPHSCIFRSIEGETGFGKWGAVIHYPANLVRGDEIWFRVRTFYPAGFDYNSYGAGERLKFLRLHTKTGSSQHEGYNDLYITREDGSTGEPTPFKWIFEGEDRWINVGEPSDKIQRESWETYEMYIRFDDVPADDGGLAIVRIWKNGQLLSEILNRKTLGTSSSSSNSANVYTYWNGAAPKSQFMYVDDITLTSDRPSDQDSEGNYFIGLGSDVVRPKPPEDLLSE